MHLLYFGVPLLALGVLLLAVAGPLGIVPIVLAVGMFAHRLSERFRRSQNEPRPGLENEPGPGVGYAHHGQAHMTPDQGSQA